MQLGKYIGYKLGDVKTEIENEGYIVEEISITSPKKYYKLNENYRVLKIETLVDNKLKITVCVSL